MPFPASFVDRMSKILGNDLSLFLESLEKPVMKSLRVNTNLITLEDFLILAKQHGWVLTPVPWEPNGFFIDRENRDLPLGKTVEHQMGLFYLQEASSMLPAAILAPTEKDIVLDMSAAPGSKTTQMCGIMQNMGLIIANDFSTSRIKALATNIERQGCINVALTTINGKMLGDILPNTFDRILLDAPCSGEGTIYKTHEYFQRWNVDVIRKTAGLQKSLIQNAFRALRPGGTLVYSTCTYAPEENEGVVDFLLKQFSGNAEIVETGEQVNREAGKLESGVTEWEGEKFDPSLKHAVRIFPHHTGTGGFFAVKIRKKLATPGKRLEKKQHSTGNYLQGKEMKRFTTFFKKHFGLSSEFFWPFIFTAHGTEVWLQPKKHNVLLPYLSMDRCGVHLCTVTKKDTLKLTTVGARAIGRWTTANAVHLTAEQLAVYLQGRDVTLSEEQLKVLTQPYVIVKDERGFIVGTGVIQEETRLKNQIPRYFLYAN